MNEVMNSFQEAQNTDDKSNKTDNEIDEKQKQIDSMKIGNLFNILYIFPFNV